MVWTGVSSDSAPCSMSCMTAVHVAGLVRDATRKMESFWMGKSSRSPAVLWPEGGGALPKEWVSTSPVRASATQPPDTPKLPPDATSASSRRVRPDHAATARPRSDGAEGSVSIAMPALRCGAA